MALQKSVVPLLVQGGLAQDTDEVALGMGAGFVLVENLKYDRAGVLKKRHGYSDVSDSVFRGLSTVADDQARSLTPHRGAMVAVLGDEPASIATFTEQGWAEHGRACALSMRRDSALRIQDAAVENAQAVVVGVWTVLVYLANETLFYKQIETATGAVVQDERILVADHVKGCRAFEVNTDVVVVYHFDDGAGLIELRAFRLKTNLGSPTVKSPDLVLDATGIDVPFDAIPSETEPNVFWAAWVPIPRVGVRVGKYQIGGLPLDAPTLTAGPLTHAEPDAGPLGMGTHASGRIWVAFSRFNGGTGDIRLLQWDPLPFALATPASTVFTGATSGHFRRPAVSLDGWVAWEDMSGLGGGFQQVDTAGALVGLRRYLWRETLQSRFFRQRSEDWILLGESTGVVGQGTYALVRPAQSQDLPLTATYHGAICLDVAAGTETRHALGSVELLETDRWLWGALVRTGLVNPNLATSRGRKGIDFVTLDFRRNQAPVLTSTEASGCLLQGGAMAPIFDGQQVVEQGFLRAPVILTNSLTGGLGSIEGADISPGVHNVYLYCCTYEWQDRRGNWHTSEPSPPLVVAVSLADDNANNILTIACLGLTRRGDSFFGRNARIAVYRTEKNSTGPYYRLDDPSAATLTNNRGSQSKTFIDTLDDATMLALGYGRLYTDGGALEHRLAPSALAICTWQNRVWLVSGEDPRQVVFSKEIVPTAAPAFNPSLLFVQIEEEATGLAPSGASLLIFSRTRVYALSGLGPVDTGFNADWRGPSVVSEAVGCTDARSIVQFPGGVLFLAESGFHLMASPQSPPAFVGAAVLQIVRDYPVCRGAAHDEENGRVLWTMARTNGQSLTLVWDYLRNAWLVWTPGGTDSTRWPGPLAVLGGVHWYGHGAGIRRSSTNLADQSDYFSWRLILPWARVGGVAGYQRVWRVLVALKRGGGVKLLTRLRHDESTAIAQTAEHLLSSLDAETGNRLVLETHVANQKGRSVQVELSEELPSGETEAGGLEIYGLSLEIGQKKGRFKAAPENRR